MINGIVFVCNSNGFTSIKMNKNLQSPTKLTEFAPLQAEEKPQSVGQIISSFFKIRNSVAVEQPSNENSDSISQESLPNWAIDSSADSYISKDSASNVYNVDVNEGRSLPNVLKRISNLLALKSTSLQNYEDTELKQYWMPDSVSKECYECSEKFTAFRRRHHCRVCGQIFCSQCCNQQIPGKIFGCTGDLRVCTYCCKVVLSYLQSSDLGADLSADLKILQESLQSKFGSSLSPRVIEDNVVQTLSSTPSETSTLKRKISVGYQEEKICFWKLCFWKFSNVTYLSTEEKCKALQNSSSLRNLFDEICRPTTGVPFEPYKYKLRTYTQCFLGSVLVDWLIFQQKANNRVQAAAICRALLEGGYIESVSEPLSFVDGYAFYRRGVISSNLPQPSRSFDIPSQEEPSWVQQIPQESSTTDSENEQVSPVSLVPGNLTSSSSYMLDLNIEANTVYLSRPPEEYKSPCSPEADYREHQETTVVRPSEQRELAPESGWFNASTLRDENGEKIAYSLLTEMYEQHEQSLLKQLLASKGLSHSWSSVIIPLIHDVVSLIRPDKNHDAVELDIRHYVQFKILSGGLRTDTSLVRGIVCNKNVAHTGMAIDIENPKILLLQCSVVYQRTEGRLMSLEPVLMQEHEYLRNVAARIVALQPNVVLVQRNVSRLAQDMLRQYKITLVYNVKQTVLERISRCTQADLVSAVDTHIGRPKLGTCKRFYLKTFDIEKGGMKTLMFFDGLPLSHLGATVLLRGASRADDDPNKNSVSEKFTVAELPFSNNFRKSLDDVTLCISPYIVFSVPYLETEVGKKCRLRQFFPKEIYFSEQFMSGKKNKWRDSEEINPSQNLANEKLKPLHPFLTAKITSNLENTNIQNLLANFRACGSRYEKKENMCIISKKAENQKTEVNADIKDVFDVANHQRLAVLFCSFSSESNNAPAFCVNPWVVYMDFYGRNDIPLGCFLERYCFRSTYFCPSKFCDTPMVKHTRRFVHNTGCVSIYLNFFDNEFSEENIVMWTSCTKCQSVSPVVPMSADTWSYSFAKYLELKFHGDVFNRRGQFSCSHSLHHDHFQYFGYKNYVASFKYTSINIWEISLPPVLIKINYDINKFQTQLIDDVRIMAQKGHEVFSLVQDKLLYSSTDDSESPTSLKQLLSKEQTQFKQRVEEVQLKLTSPTIESKDFEEKELYLAYWKIADVLVKIKRSIVETADNWNLRLSEATKKKDTDKKKEKSVSTDLDSPSGEDIPDDQHICDQPEGKDSGGVLTKKIKSLDNSDLTGESYVPSSPKCHLRSQSDGTVSQTEEVNDNRKESDKKTVKNILSQLLPTTPTLTSILPPFSSQEHYTLPMGVSIPVVVYENEPSSIVAYTLNSYDYKKAFDDLVNKRNVDQTPSPINKRKSNNDKEKSDDDKSLSLLGFLRNKDTKPELNSPVASPGIDTKIYFLAVKSRLLHLKKLEELKKTRNAHIEIQFQDSTCNFFCRVYLAEKFAALRSSVLPIGEEAYIRSLSRSVQWNARGGKSGSNFAKTADDRFILKDTSKSEVQLFLESASNYFVYMNKCYTTKQPTLLGKIVGIYHIIFRNNSNVTYRNHLLVMENLFYNRKVTQKFDLKGSMRNRLVVPDNQEGEIVLLDENLLKMTCESPLYILPHSKAVLTAAIQNDTEFLSAQSVMDYSLLVGLDSENKELVLGIIDYIRTFTWDKKLETIVKKVAFLGARVNCLQ
ncbi:hypothetical protein NQ318_007282 [Aromia moschata]|uniref:1-phosphatidylinositol-3-phosphate 5-kinase n=1 Tax=Aromia moschata TaxID=1265417 RepID=A0AAV8YZK4_9CUCU|nr:hypothetical protein NQ318_007282 [Aromia moschata]